MPGESKNNNTSLAYPSSSNVGNSDLNHGPGIGGSWLALKLAMEIQEEEYRIRAEEIQVEEDTISALKLMQEQPSAGKNKNSESSSIEGVIASLATITNVSTCAHYYQKKYKDKCWGLCGVCLEHTKYTDWRVLKFKTDKCNDWCRGLCGYCPEHEIAWEDENQDWVIGPKPNERGATHEKPTLWLSTPSSLYPNIEPWDSCNLEKNKGLYYGYGIPLSVKIGQTFTHRGLPAIAGKGKVFGLTCETSVWLLTVGGKCWSHKN